METVDKPKVYRIWDKEAECYIENRDGKAFWKKPHHAKAAMRLMSRRSKVFEIHEFNLEFTQSVEVPHPLRRA